MCIHHKVPTLLEQSRSIRLVNSSSVGALAFLVWDICITFDDEVEWIWCKPKKSWIKWQFLFTRYFALAAQIINRYLATAITFNTPFLFDRLKTWYTCQVVVGHLLMTALEVILIVRVYALYNKNRWVALGFLGLIIGESITMVIGVILTLPGHEFGKENIITTTPDSFTYFGISAIVSQTTILILTLIKYKTGVQAGWTKVPVIVLMLRDGTLSFVALFALSMITIIYTILDDSFAAVSYSWLLTVVSSAGCRLIINMQRLSLSEGIYPTGSSRFTTYLSESD